MGVGTQLVERSPADGQARSVMALACLTGLLWMAGCAADVQPAPQLFEVCQNDRQDLCQAWAYAGEQVQLRLTGVDLSEVWEVDLGSDKPPVTVGQFRAWIGSVELLEVHRAQEAFLGQETLLAELPSGLALGFYSVELETPGGQRAVLGGSAFEIRDPLRLQLQLDKLRLPRGDLARLSVSVQNRGTAEIDRVTLELSQGGTGAFSLPPRASPFTLASLGQREVSFDLIAGGPGEVQLAVAATGLADGWIPIVQQTPQSIAAQILERADLSLQAVVSPSTVTVGQPFQLQVLATNTGGVAAHQVQLAPPEASGAGQVQWSVDPDQVMTVAPGAGVTFTWSGSAAQAGTAWISTSVRGVESISQRELAASLTSPIPLEILPQ